MPPATLSAVATTKPRRSIARARRWQSGASSSTISNVRSASGRFCSSLESVSAAERFGRSLVSMALPLWLPAPQPGLTIGVSHRRGPANSLHHFQIGTIPRYRNMRAAFRQIVEYQVCAAALEQGLRDEDAEPHMIRRSGARRNVGLAKSSEEMKRKSRPIIAYLDRDGSTVPERRDADLAPGELNGVLNEVVEPMLISGLRRTSGSSGPGCPAVAKISLTP